MRPGSSLLADFYFCLGFFTRLPFPSAASTSEPPSLANFSRAVRMLPAAGGLVGALAAIAMAAASRFGFPSPLAAPLAGFSGGTTRERKLEIIRDSRIGTFGAVALVLSLYLRATSLALIVDESLGLAGAGLGGAAGFV